MAQLKFGSAGVTTREIDISGPVARAPVGTPAGIVGTALNGPAFVPVTVGTIGDWYNKFGETDGKKFGPLAVFEWLRNAQAVTYLRVLGTGDGRERTDDGTVTNAGFVVGDNVPNPLSGVPGTKERNPFANNLGVAGRTYFLGCFMSESAGSTVFSEAGIQGYKSAVAAAAGSHAAAVPIVRGVLMAPSGVILTLSSSVAGISSAQPGSALVALQANIKGSQLGDVVLGNNASPKQEFSMFLNGHQGLTASYPNIITASFDVTSNNYFANVLNTDPNKIQEAGHYLYANWDIHPVLAAVTGTAVVESTAGAGATGTGKEQAAFLVTGSTARNYFDPNRIVPNYENFQDRFGHAKSPWFISQKFGGKPINLFRFHALDDGVGPAYQYKISIENLTPSNDPMNKYGNFTVVLREFNDRDLDKKTIANETFSGVNLDPSSDRYIAKVIGDIHAYYDFDREESAQKMVIQGNYENRSNYVRVEVHPDVENGFVDPVALPIGFRGIDHLVTSGSSPLSSSLKAVENAVLTVDSVFNHVVTPPLPFRKKITINDVDSAKENVEPKFYWGVQFEHPQTVLRQNGSILPNDGIKSFGKYYPDFAGFLTGSNSGQPDTAQLGIVDSDRFCNNMFSLEHLQVVTGTTGDADSNQWKSAVYVRDGNIISNNTNKTRALRVDDFLTNKSFVKYTTFMQGGFNGVNIFDKDSEEINNTAVHADMGATTNRGAENGPNVKAYMKAIEIMKNVVNMDIQLLAIPSIREPIVTDAAILAVEERFDAMYVMDIEQLDENYEQVEDEDQIPSVVNTINNFKNRTVDSSFAAAYFPDVLYRDPKGINVQAPPSVLVLGALALNDAVGHPWFAPAGFTRGALPQEALEPRVRLKQKDMDSLYDNSINPIVAFPGSAQSGTNPRGGIVVWGQKTLQVAASALDRVNVRRLLIEIRRQVRDIANTILFEPNRAATLARFSASVTPRLQRIQALSGLERFKVIIDSSTTTQDDIENNTIRGKIFVQPTKSIEFVSLDFVVANNLAQVQ